MKLKYYLRGIGLGIIFATIVMTVSANIHNNYLSKEQIIEEATKLGMVMPESQKKDTQLQEQESENENTQINTLQQESEMPSESESQQSSEIQQETQTQESLETQVSSQTSSDIQNQDMEIILTQDTYVSSHGGEVIITKSQDNPTKEIIMTIKFGATSEDVAEVLYECGYIESIESFNRYMSSNAYNRKVRTGEKVIQAGSTYEEIARILLTKYEDEIE